MAWKLQLDTSKPDADPKWEDVTVGDTPITYAREADARRMLNGLSDDHGGRCRTVECESADEKKRREDRAAAAAADTKKKTSSSSSPAAPRARGRRAR